MMLQDPFTGKVALIFGAGLGIGRAVAREWARRGATLALADINLDAARKTAELITAAGGQAIALPADVTSDDSIAGAVGQTEAALGAIDIAMNNVGGILNGNPQDIPFDEWRRIAELNYFATLRGTLCMLPRFLTRGSGHIVNTASFAGLYPYAASRIPYAAAKAAIIALSQNLAIDCEPKGVRVTCFIPGPVATRISDTMTSWSENCTMLGPGEETTLITPGQAAIALSDGMAQGRIMVPSDPIAFDILQRWASDPDAFIRAKIADVSRGNAGMPGFSDEVLKSQKKS